MNNLRRKFIKSLGLGGLFGVPAVAAATPVLGDVKVTGPEPVMVFYVNVGYLSPEKAEAFIEKTKQRLGPLPAGWKRFIFPVRHEQTRVHVLYPDKAANEVEMALNSLELRTKKEVSANWSKIREQVQDHTLLLLGAPVIRIELDQQEIDGAFDFCIQLIDSLYRRYRRHSVYDLAEHLIPIAELKEMTRGMAMIALGRIKSHSNFNEGFNLSREGQDLLHKYKDQLVETLQEINEEESWV